MSFFISPKNVLKTLTDEQVMCKLLECIMNSDMYLEDFLEDEISALILNALEMYDIAFVSSDKERVLLTQNGEKLLYTLTFPLPYS